MNGVTALQMINQETQKSIVNQNQDTETSLSTISLKIKSNTKRFTRNGSISRSKSKEREYSTQFQGVYIKNAFELASRKSSNKNNQQTSKQDQKKKRDSTPAKVIRKNHKRGVQASSVNNSIEKQLRALKLQRHCDDLQKQLAKNNVLIIGMQNKISKLEEQILAKDNEITYLTHKLKRYEEKSTKQCPEKKNNLTKLRKQIAETKHAEILSSSEVMEQQIKNLQIENSYLSSSLKETQILLNQKQQSAKSINSEKQSQLHDLVAQLKKQIDYKDHFIHKMEIQINMLKLREACQKQNKQQTKKEELNFIKFRFQNLLKKYQESRTQLAAYKRKEERVNYLFPTNISQFEDISFELSP